MRATADQTGAEIRGLLDNLLGGSGWRTNPTGSYIRDALDATLGGSGWRTTPAVTAVTNRTIHTEGVDGQTTYSLSLSNGTLTLIKRTYSGGH